MKEPILVLDCDYLAHRAAYSTGGLSWKGQGTGIVYGLLRDILTLRTSLQTSKFVFCWDCGQSLRKKLLPSYKASRPSRVVDEDQIAILDDMRRQMKDLRKTILPDLGFSNILYQRGFEADDVIASVVGAADEDCVIVSRDEDFFQLLRKNVSIWNPTKKQMTTARAFSKEWGLKPKDWILVKAIAGCKTDEVGGLEGIGNKTAAKYLRGALGVKTKAYQQIHQNKAFWEKNIPLVELPFKGTPVFEVKQKGLEPNWDRWKKVCKSMGMQSLLQWS